ncbi:MAG: hypothetical protein OXU45_08695 [Candidatus Melainabacteria bacterium]|nr:hypothetical protein [Candidatus Melainabacteria bacterium]
MNALAFNNTTISETFLKHKWAEVAGTDSAVSGWTDSPSDSTINDLIEPVIKASNNRSSVTDFPTDIQADVQAYLAFRKLPSLTPLDLLKGALDRPVTLKLRMAFLTRLFNLLLNSDQELSHGSKLLNSLHKIESEKENLPTLLGAA